MSVIFVIYIIPYYLFKVFFALQGEKSKEKIVISAHPGIDPGPLIQKSDTLTTRLVTLITMSSRARLEITVHCTFWADNPSIGHIRIPIQGKNFDFFTLLMWERSGTVVERLTRDQRAAGSSLTGVTALCP